ncbi:MAG: hypothetical protein P8176_02075 [Gammaproteobacteria bacterium]
MNNIPLPTHDIILNAFATVGWVIVIFATVLGVLNRASAFFTRTLATQQLCLLAGIITGACWIPTPPSDLPLITYLHGLLYTPSAALLLIGIFSLMRRMPTPFRLLQQPPRLATPRTHLTAPLTPWHLALAISAIILYPTALGLGPWDAYRYGYFPISSVIIAGIGVLLWLWPHRPAAGPIALWLTLGVGMRQLGLCESNNVWDALLDPFAACWAIFRLWAPHPHILNKPHNTFNAIKHKK